jgi:hypothetical protein
LSAVEILKEIYSVYIKNKSVFNQLDIDKPSISITGTEHRKFLKIAKNKAFVKCVITKNTKLQEIKKSAELIKSVSKNIALILQPSIDKNIPDIQDLYKLYSQARKVYPNIYLMVQMHKVYKIK